VRGVKAVPREDLNTLAAACEKTEWGANVSKEIEHFAKQYQFDLATNLLYAAKSPDLSSEVQSMIAAKPGAMLFASYASDAILMVKTLKSLKAKPNLIWGQDAGFDKPEFRELGADIEGILTRSVFLPSVARVKKVSGQVNEIYKKKYGVDLDGASARAFTGLQAWVYVLEKAGSTEPKAIQQAANEIEIAGKELVVPWAGINFEAVGDETGQNVLGKGLIGQYQMQDGKIGLEIVYPFDLATADMMYPFKGF
jgi:branched-chain amino acid transport system substrate-binding protein